LSESPNSETAEINELRQKVLSFPNNSFFRFSYAQLLAKKNHSEEAVEQLSICLKTRNDWMMAALLKAKLEISLERKEDAELSLIKTIELAKAQDHQDPLDEASELLALLKGS
jgi:predicted negative regulator of RcsB-dependent stress response